MQEDFQHGKKQIANHSRGSKKVESVATPKKDAFIDGIKLGEDEGTVDGEWYKALIVSDTISANVAVIDKISAQNLPTDILKELSILRQER